MYILQKVTFTMFIMFTIIHGKALYSFLNSEMKHKFTMVIFSQATLVSVFSNRAL